MDQHPDIIFVLDHVAKPRIKDAIFQPWSEQMKDLSKRENVFCKLSGMATEANWQNWTVDELLPYMETALECFGAVENDVRLRLAGCAPCSRRYESWVKIFRDFISTLSSDEQCKIEGKKCGRGL